MSSSIPSRRPVSAWYFKAGASSVKKITYDGNLKTLQSLIGEYRPARVDCIGITLPDNSRYSIFFNENGMYEDVNTNLCATQVLGKLPINWDGSKGMMKGNYVVLYMKDADDEEGRRDDIPEIGFREWINLVKPVIEEGNRRKMKQLNKMSKMFDDGVYQVYTGK